MNEEIVDYGSLIDAECRRRNIPPTQAADEIGVPQGNVSRWINKVHEPQNLQKKAIESWLEFSSKIPSYAEAVSQEASA